MIYWRTRSTGVAFLGTGIATYLLFLGCIGVLKKFDKVAWVHEPPMQHFGPDQQASLIIYYRAGTTDRQIEDFVEHKLENYPSNLPPQWSEQPAQPDRKGITTSNTNSSPIRSVLRHLTK